MSKPKERGITCTERCQPVWAKLAEKATQYVLLPAAAMQVIGRRACEPITVEEVMEHVRVSRRTFEKRFKVRFGRTPHHETRRVQFEQARCLLAETDWSIVQIAPRIGHSDAKRFISLFRKTFGDPPGGVSAQASFGGARHDEPVGLRD